MKDLKRFVYSVLFLGAVLFGTPLLLNAIYGSSGKTVSFGFEHTGHSSAKEPVREVVKTDTVKATDTVVVCPPSACQTCPGHCPL